MALRPLVICLMLLSLLSGASVFAGGPEVAAEQDGHAPAWSVTTIDNGKFVRAITRGKAVYGHELGFLVRWPNCDDRLLWIALTSYTLEKQAKETIATFEMIAANDRRTVELPVVTVWKAFSRGIAIVVFTNRTMVPEIADFLRTHASVRLRVTAPESLVKEFDDFPYERFDVSDFARAEKLALTLCRSRRRTMRPKTNARSNLDRGPGT